MRRSRIIAAVVLSVGLVLAPAVAPAVVATPSASAAEGLPYVPSPSKWRQWMINVVSSVLGAATPNKWKAEQIANVYKYDGGFETLNQKFGIDGIRYNESGQIVGVRRSSIGSGTYTDVVIAGLEQTYRDKAVKGNGPVRAPATPIKSFFKVVGGAAAAVTAYELSAQLGGFGTNLVGSFFGFDANGIVCAQQGFDNDVQRFIFRSMVGQNCDAMDMLVGFTPNGDAGVSYAALTYAGLTAQYRGKQVNAPTLADYFCYDLTGSVPAGYIIYYRLHDGTYTNAPLTTSPGLSNSCKPAGVRQNAAWKSTYAGAGADTPQLWLAPTGTASASVVGASVATTTPTTNDPDRRLDCKVTYTDSTTATRSSALYKESSGVLGQAQCPETPLNKTPSKVEVNEVQPGNGTTQEVYDESVTDDYKDWWTQYPECRSGACSLDLIRLAPSPAVSCFDLEEGCIDWHTDPNKAENYLCRYGVHDVALEECNVYAGLFQPGRVTTGSPYTDPSTGEWSGGQNAPSGRTQNMQRALQDPTNIRSCDFQDVGFDPVGWILRGGQCLAEWTFVARPAVVDVQTAALEESWDGTGPGKLATAVGAWSFVPPGTGCSGLTIPWSETLGHNIPDWNILNACSGSPLQPAAVASTVVLSIGSVLGLIFALTRVFGGTVGFTGLGGRGD